MVPEKLVSVIVPTFARPALLHRALVSISEQTYPHYEAVVVNDGGVDIRGVIEQFGFARLVEHEENKGLPAARNTGIRNAYGEYITYLDDDDKFYPNHLEQLVSGLAGGYRFAYTDAHIQYRGGNPKLYMSQEFDREGLRRVNQFPVCCAMHERGLIDEVGWFDESLPSHEDWDLWIRMSEVTDFLHIREITCLVDKTQIGMMDDGTNMRRGYFMVFNKYAENPIVLPPIA